MAAAFPVDHITCSVCFEIYRNPHILQCLHTFCHQCIQQIKDGSYVECPECRKHSSFTNVKRDFKIQSFIDWHKRQDNSPTEETKPALVSHVKIPENCELCGNTVRNIHSKCVNCDQFMCFECTNCHTAITVCKSHIIKPVTDIVQSIQSNIKEKVGELDKGKREMSKTLTTVSDKIKEIERYKFQQKADVAKCKEEIIREIETYCGDLHKKIEEVNEEMLQNLRANEQELSITIQEFQEQINYLSQLAEEDDLALLSQSANSVTSSNNYKVQNKVKVMTQMPQVLKADAKSRIYFAKHLEWDVTKTLHLEVDGELYTGPIRKLKRPTQFTHMIKHAYTPLQTKQLTINPERVCMIKDEIWVAGNEGIHVYNKNCYFIREIGDDSIKWATGLVQTHTGDIIVSCRSYRYKGLHLLDRNGIYIKPIANGYFSDVSAYNNLIYAMDYNTHKVNVFKLINKQWSLVREIKLAFSNGDDYDKLCVNSTGIYVTSFKNSCLYIHNIDTGECISSSTAEKGEKLPGKFSGIFNCKVDDSGNILTADNGHHCLQIYSVNKSWYIISVPMKLPRDVVADHSASNMWVITSEKKLIKFTRS